MTGAAGDTTTTDSRSRRNRASRRGGQLTTRALGSSYGSACPHLRAPGASVPMVAPYATTPRIAAEHWHRGSHTGYQRHRKLVRDRASPHRALQGMPFEQDCARYDIQARRGRRETLAAPRRAQPVAQSHPRGKVHRRNRGRQIESSSRCRLTLPSPKFGDSSHRRNSHLCQRRARHGRPWDSTTLSSSPAGAPSEENESLCRLQTSATKRPLTPPSQGLVPTHT
jgi:hypothetical protein